MSKKHELLINTEDILILLTPLAVLVGDREAIALQQIHYWLEINRKGEKVETHFFEGKWWAYNTWNKWRESNFPFWSVATTRRVFDSLVLKGLIVLRSHDSRNKGSWVTICYDELDVFKKVKASRKKRESKPRKSDQNEQTENEPLMTVGSDQNEQTGLIKMSRLSDQNEQTLSTTENTPETSIPETNKTTADAGADNSRPETTFDDLPGYMESRAVHGAVYNRQHAFKEKIVEVWGWPVGSTQNTHREQQLRGVATKGEWKECNLPLDYAERLEPDDLPYWKTWELSRGVQSADKILVSKAAPVQASIMAFIDAGKPRTIVKSTNGTHAATPNQPRHARAPRQMTAEEIAAEDAKWAAMNAPVENGGAS